MNSYYSNIRKWILSLIVLLWVGMTGAAYQYYYLEERGEYEEKIKESYIEFFGREPSKYELRHLAILALDRYGPTEFYRNEEDYQRLFQESAQ